MKNKKVEATGVSLSEALNSLSELGEYAKHTCAQPTISSPNESFVSSGAKRASLAKPKVTNSRLMRKWR